MARFINALGIVTVIVMIAVAAVVYAMKKNAEVAGYAVASLGRQIEDEHERIATLKAEWSLLDQPARLQALVEHFKDKLVLAPITADQIGHIGEIPLAPKPEGPPADAAAGGPAAADAAATLPHSAR